MALVRDPRTGQLIEDGRPAVNPNAPNMGRAFGDVVGGAARVAPAYAQSVLQAGVAQLLGGQADDPYAGGRAQLERLTQGATTLADAGRDTLGGIQGAALGLVGAQPRQAQVAAEPATQAPTTATPSAPAMPAQTAQPVAAPDPFVAGSDARIAAITAESRQPMGADTAGLNRTMAENLSAGRPEAPIYQAATPGNFSMYNTDQPALAARAAPSAGINFGFGVGGSPSASEYLNTMRAQDQQTEMATQQRRLEADAGVARIGLRNRLESDDVFVRRAAQQEMETLDNRVNQGVAETGETTRRGMQDTTAQNIAQTQGQFGLGQAQIGADAGITQQIIASEQRAQEVQMQMAQDQMQFENDPTAQRATFATQLAEAMLQAGDVQGAINALYGLQPAGAPKPKIEQLRDNLGRVVGTSADGMPIPYTDEQIAELVRAGAAYNQPTQ